MNRSASPWKALLGVTRLFRLLRRERFDIVHTHTSVAGAIGRITAWLAGVPIRVHMLHAYAGHDYQHRAKARLFTALERGLDYFTTFYVAGSNAIAEKGIGKGIFGADKVQRIYYALDLARFDSSPADPASVRGSLKLAADDCLVVLVGRLEEQKGVEFLIEAAAILSRRGVNATFVVVGDGPLRGALEAQRDESKPQPDVRFVGWQTDVAAYMRAADVVAVPSRWEAFGIVNLEAMAAGKPIVGSRVEGIPEVVPEGRCGILVDVGDVKALAEALESLIANPDRRHQMGSQGRSWVETHFSARAMVEAHEELYRRLLSETRRPTRQSE